MRGVIVIEPAGNGSTNVDSQIPRDEMGRMKDSGAIMVGADTGGTGIPVSTSNFGSRVNLHGWGLMVMTLGYGAAVAGGLRILDSGPAATTSGNSTHRGSTGHRARQRSWRVPPRRFRG